MPSCSCAVEGLPIDRFHKTVPGGTIPVGSAAAIAQTKLVLVAAMTTLKCMPSYWSPVVMMTSSTKSGEAYMCAGISAPPHSAGTDSQTTPKLPLATVAGVKMVSLGFHPVIRLSRWKWSQLFEEAAWFGLGLARASVAASVSPKAIASAMQQLKRDRICRTFSDNFAPSLFMGPPIARVE